MTEKQKRFVDEYLIDLNATQAAIRAGYKQSDYTDTNANKLLENTSVKEAIDKEMAERSKRTGVTADRVVRELAKIAFANITDIIDVDGATVKPDVTAEDAAAIQSVKVKLFGEGDIEREIKLADKLKALDLLGKHLGLFKDNIELNANITSEKLTDVFKQIGGKGLEE